LPAFQEFSLRWHGDWIRATIFKWWNRGSSPKFRLNSR